MKNIPRVFTEKEFVRVLSGGGMPKWYDPSKLSARQRTRLDSEHTAEAVVYMDFLAKEFVLRKLSWEQGLFKKTKTEDSVHRILDLALDWGLLAEQVEEGKSGYVATELLKKYWSKIFFGERLPQPRGRSNKRKSKVNTRLRRIRLSGT